MAPARSQVLFVTGSGGGIGRAVTELALLRGHRVVATTKNPAGLAGLSEAHGDRVLVLPLAITDRADCAVVVTEAMATFGRVDALVNTAGFAPLGVAETLAPELLSRVIENNLIGTINVTQALAPTLREQGSGRILQVTSVGGTLKGAGLAAYEAAGQGIAGFSQVLDVELRPHGVTVVLVEPASTSTGWARGAAGPGAVPPPYDGTVGAAVSRHGGTAIAPEELAAAAADIVALIEADAAPSLRVAVGG